MLGRLIGTFSGKRCISSLVSSFDKYLLGSEKPVGPPKLIAKPSVIYNLEIHDLKPGYTSDYLKNAKSVLPEIHSSKDIPVELYGQFVVELGQQDRIYTVWRHTNGYADLDKTMNELSNRSQYVQFKEEQGKLMRKRDQQICYEFSFWPQYIDDYDGGLFEIRSYSLKAGCLYEWANAWSTAITLREEDAVMGLCSQIGGMYNVHHIWRYRDLEDRRRERSRVWEKGTTSQWGDIVVRTEPLIKDLQVNIMKATDYSPLR